MNEMATKNPNEFINLEAAILHEKDHEKHNKDLDTLAACWLVQKVSANIQKKLWLPINLFSINQ
jgi:hypothetical protein